MSKLYKNKDNLILEIPLAGHDPKEIEITASDGKLTVESSKNPRDWELISDYNYNRFFSTYYNEESSENKYSSTWSINGVDCDKITSTWDNGLLLITLPPKEKEENRIKVKF
jgi:HSP20 family molecular chaperone IbpA